ncbi:MAG: DUF1501 domain-containing protein, partial [Roseibacillus sp.]|nr:DUF1501 domain-containing protein [Roseibacillus sp.]
MKGIAHKLDELDRRNFLTGAAASTLGVTILPGLAGAAETKVVKPAAHASARNLIFLYMAGGMTHVDTFDPKTTGGIAGPSRPAGTNVDGVQLSNMLPQLGKQADKFAVVRSMTTKTGDHGGGNYLMHTGYARR